MMLRRMANNALKIVAKMMRNMQVALYWPVVVGIQDMEKRGVVVEVKNVMAILSIPIMDVIPIDPSVEVDIGISAMVVVGDIDIDISMFIFRKHNPQSGIGARCRNKLRVKVWTVFANDVFSKAVQNTGIWDKSIKKR